MIAYLRSKETHNLLISKFFKEMSHIHINDKTSNKTTMEIAKRKERRKEFTAMVG